MVVKELHYVARNHFPKNGQYDRNSLQGREIAISRKLTRTVIIRHLDSSRLLGGDRSERRDYHTVAPTGSHPPGPPTDSVTVSTQVALKAARHRQLNWRGNAS
jgi:hypothetical protein